MALVKTGKQILYAARALCNDVDPERFATSIPMSSILLKHAVTEFIEEVGWNGDVRTDIAFGAGAWQSADITDVHPITYGAGQWDGKPLEWASNDDFAQLVTPDIVSLGAPQQGVPAYWSFYVAAANTTANVQIYPAPQQAGMFSYSLTAQAVAEDDPSTGLLLTKPSQQALELLLACKMLRRMSVETMARLGLGPSTLQATELEYRKRADEAIWRGNGQTARQNRVTVVRKGRR